MWIFVYSVVTQACMTSVYLTLSGYVLNKGNDDENNHTFVLTPFHKKTCQFAFEFETVDVY